MWMPIPFLHSVLECSPALKSSDLLMVIGTGKVTDDKDVFRTFFHPPIRVGINLKTLTLSSYMVLSSSNYGL